MGGGIREGHLMRAKCAFNLQAIDHLRPGPHWTPKDDAARKAAKDVKPGKVNPIEDMGI